MTPDDAVRSRIRQVLIEDWDPHNVSARPEAHGTYDGYVKPLHDLLRRGAGEQELVDWLHDREKETMCFPSLGTQRLLRVAKKLQAIVNR